MTSRHGRVAGAALLLAGLLGSSACDRAVLFPAVSLTPIVQVVDPSDVVDGRAVTLRYSWTAGPDFVADGPYRVFVHFIDDHGAMAFTDDHAPPGGAAYWKPGGRHPYERRVVLPEDTGELRVRVGLVSRTPPYKTRVTEAATGASTFPVVAVIRARHNPTLPEESVAGAAGFDFWERDAHTSMYAHRWTRRESRFLFLRPATGGRLQLQATVPRNRLTKDPTVTIRVADVQASLSPSSNDRFILELDVPGDGAARLVEGTLVSDEVVTERDREVAVCVERFRIVPLPPRGRPGT